MRGVLVAAGLLLIGAALGAMLATNPAWAGTVVLLGALCFVIAAVLSLPPVRQRVPWLMTASERDDQLRRLLGRELAAGTDLLGEFAPLTDQIEPIAAIRSRAENWATRVRDELDEHRPGWSAVFRADPIHVQYGWQFGERDQVRNWLAQRVAALRGLVEKLG